jgi:hypothetical protein
LIDTFDAHFAGRSAFEKKTRNAPFYKPEGSKKSRRSRADDEWFIVPAKSLLRNPVEFKDGLLELLSGLGDLDRINKMSLVPLPRVEALPQQSNFAVALRKKPG